MEDVTIQIKAEDIQPGMWLDMKAYQDDGTPEYEFEYMVVESTFEERYTLLVHFENGGSFAFLPSNPVHLYAWYPDDPDLASAVRTAKRWEDAHADLADAMKSAMRAAGLEVTA